MIGSILLVEQKSYMTNVPSFYLLDYSPSLPTILHSRLEDEIPFVLVFVKFYASFFILPTPCENRSRNKNCQIISSYSITVVPNQAF